MTVDTHQLTFHGQGLVRPECAIAHDSGYLFAPHWKGSGGVSIISPDGEVHHIYAKGLSFDLKPNGIVLEDNGTLLLAHLGAETGGLFRLFRDGAVQSILRQVNGHDLPPCNFAMKDRSDRIWLTVSTRKIPRARGYRHDVADGFIILIDGENTRIVADDIGYTNECALSEDGSTLYVNATFARQTLAFDVMGDGSLSHRRIYAQYGAGTFPDGLAVDTQGSLWITSIVSNRVIRVDPDGRQEIVLEDSDPDHLEVVENAYQSHEMGRPHLDQARSKILKNISNLSFGGPDRSTAYLGCLLGEQITSFNSGRSGLELPNHTAEIGPLVSLIGTAKGTSK